jgi:hypothetical protein
MAELEGAELVHGLAWARGVPVLRIPVIGSSPWYNSHGPRVMEDSTTAIYDIRSDPGQLRRIADKALEERLAGVLATALKTHDAPPEVLRRLGLG